MIFACVLPALKISYSARMIFPNCCLIADSGGGSTIWPNGKTLSMIGGSHSRRKAQPLYCKRRRAYCSVRPALADAVEHSFSASCSGMGLPKKKPWISVQPWSTAA